MIRWRAGYASVVAAVMVLTAACGSTVGTGAGAPSLSPTNVTSTPSPTVSPTKSPVCAHGSPIYMVQPYAPTTALTAAYRPVIASLSTTLGCHVTFQIAASVQAEIAAVKAQHVTFAEFAGLGSGFALRGSHPVIQAVATYGSDFNGTPAAFISALYDDPHFGDVDLLGLAGKRVALTTPGSLSGDYFPRAALIEAGVISKVTTVYTGSHLQALRNLTCPSRTQARRTPCTKFNYVSLNSRVMGPAAESHEWDPGKYTQIWHSDPIPYTAIGVSAAMPDALRKQLQAALVTVPAAAVRGIAALIQFAGPKAGPGLVAVNSSTYCQSSNLDLCDVIKTLKLTPGDVRQLDGEGL